MAQHQLLWAAAIAAALFSGPGAHARVPVAAQALDDDCGAAALVTILRMAGVEASEKELLGHRSRPQRKGAGLSALDLKEMVAATAAGVQLNGEWRTETQLIEAVGRSPVLVLLYERGKSTKEGTPGFGHFVVLEAWSKSRGFLVADPAVGKRGFLSMEQVQPKAHGRTRDGRRELLLMRLSRSGRAVAFATPVTYREERHFRTIEELRRLSTGLPAGKIRVTLGLDAETYSSGLGDGERADLKLTGQTANLTVEYGLDSRTALVLSGGVGRGGAILSGPAFGRLDLGSSVRSTPMQIAVSRRVDLGLPENFAVDVSAGAFLKNLLKPVALQGGITTQAQFGRTALIGGVDLAVVRERKRLGVRLAPTLGAGFELVRGWSLSGNMSAVASPQGIEDASLGLSLQTAVAKNWFASAYAAQSVYSIDGAKARRIGLSLTYALPNQLR